MADDKFVQIDGTWYQVGDDEHTTTDTTTGLLIPPLTQWVRELPEAVDAKGRPTAFWNMVRPEKKLKAKAKK